MSRAYHFTSQIDRIDMGISIHVIPVPPKIATKVGNAKRVLLTLEDQVHRRALQGVKSGSPYIGVGLQILKPLGLRYGSPVSASIAVDPEADAMHIAEELTEALSQDTDAQARWDTFTPGKKRSINHYIDSAKRPETRAKRAVEMTQNIRTHTLHGDK